MDTQKTQRPRHTISPWSNSDFRGALHETHIKSIMSKSWRKSKDEQQDSLQATMNNQCDRL